MKTFTNPNPKEIVVPIIDLHRWKKYERVYNGDNGTINDKNETKTEDMSDYSSSLNVSDYSFSKRSSCERLNDTWENSGKMETRNSSSGCETTLFEDTSGIQSNDSSSNTHTSNMQSTPPLCLSDELATTNYKLDTTQVLSFAALNRESYSVGESRYRFVEKKWTFFGNLVEIFGS